VPSGNVPEWPGVLVTVAITLRGNALEVSIAVESKPQVQVSQGSPTPCMMPTMPGFAAMGDFTGFFCTALLGAAFLAVTFFATVFFGAAFAVFFWAISFLFLCNFRNAVLTALLQLSGK
jgi:hypothetical protein